VKRLLLTALVAAVACSPLAASQEHIAPWKSVTFVSKATELFPETTVTVESDGVHIQAIRVTNKQFDLKVPKEAFADLAQPLVETVQLSSEPGYDKTPWMYLTFGLAGPGPGGPWDSQTFRLRIKDGKVAGRMITRVKGGQSTDEELPYVTPDQPAGEPGAKAAAVAYDVHDGYFVSNKFEPQAPASFVVAGDQKAFDDVFGVAMVMGDRSHRLPAGALGAKMVVSAIKRGKAFWGYTVQGVTAEAGVLTIRYTTTVTKSDSAEFSCPLIVSVPKGDYTAVQFLEDGKVVKKMDLAAH
jgi:hypothetical protein